MKTTSSITNQITELKNSIAPVCSQIKLLETELELLNEQQEEKIMLDNKSTINLFNDNGAEFVFADLEADVNRNKVGEDDGTLHISIGQIRGCFICNQDLSRKEWNAEARTILKNLGIPFSRLNN
jgi:hypothetical protein